MTTSNELRAQIADTVDKVKAQTPLSGSITNFVTVDFVANAQLAAGGSAAMVYLPDEGEALAEISQSFYINVGTLLPSHEETMCATASKLCALGRPWVLDPVGIGLGDARARILQHFKNATPTIIRCNASEAIALATLWDLDLKDADGVDAGVKGVDSTNSVDDAIASAVALARHIHGAVAVSGEEDIVADGKSVVRLRGGSSLMEKVTGFGCSLGGVCAVYAACAPSPLVAAVAASAAFNLAGYIAEKCVTGSIAGDPTSVERGGAPASVQGSTAGGPASFKVHFIDALYNAASEEIAACDMSVEEA